MPVLCSEHLTGDGQEMFEHAAKLGWEGIISKRADAPYRLHGQGGDGMVPHGLKPNPQAAGYSREPEVHDHHAHQEAQGYVG